MTVTVENSAPTSTFHGDVSIRSHLAHTIGPLFVRPVLGHTPIGAPILFSLKLLDKLADLHPMGTDISRIDVKTGTWSAHLYTPKNNHCAKTMVYFHGGAFLSGGLGTHRKIVEHLAVRNGCSILSVAYRQYPQVRLDTTIADGVAAVKWLIENQGVKAKDIVIAGDSAGGGLAVRVAGELMKERKKVAGVISLSGWLDFDVLEKRTHRLGKRDAYIPAAKLEKIAKLILGRDPLPEDSPVMSIRKGFPPLLLICGHNEILRLDTEHANRRAHQAGVRVETHYFRGGVHAFPVATNLFPEGEKAQAIMRDFVISLSEKEAAK